MARSSCHYAEAYESIQSPDSDTPLNQSAINQQQPPHHPTAPSVSTFQNARIDGDVSNNRVYTAGRDLVVNDNDLVTMILLPHVASGAIFDSDERYSAGRCHPGTRRKMIDRVKNWIGGRSPDAGILWMYGAAGAGKSSVMQSICEFLRDSDPERNGASFFFARGHPDRGKGTKLFGTLAYQLAMRFPSLRAEINNALYRDATLPTKSMDIQLRSLIIDPLLRCKEFPSPTAVIFIDGLDECGVDHAQGVDIQSQIISLISKSLVEKKVPIRFMIASRPEYWIRDLFETSPLSDITLRLSLRDDIDADKDILKYLTENFDEIRLKKKRIMQSVALPWPPTRIIHRFVQEASGQYVYPSTILKFVGDHPFKNPEEQLQIMITPGPHQAVAYSELDRLYATILSVYPGWETMRRVLGGILIDVNLTVIRVILGVSQTELTLVLDALSSLINVVPPKRLSKYDQLLIPIFGPSLEDEEISFYHLSFREFLLDKARSGWYYIDIKAIHMEVIGGLFSIIQRNLYEDYEIEPHVSYNISLSEYRRMMAATLSVFPSDPSYDFRGLFPVLNSTMEKFRRFDPARRMNHPACFMRDMDILFKTLSQISHTIVNTKAENKPDAVEQDISMDSFLAMANQLQNLAHMARNIGIHLLSLCDGFRITRTLFFIHYLTHSAKKQGVQLRELLTNPGCTVDDCLSTIYRHRHIIDLLCERLDQSSQWMPWIRTGWESPLLLSVVDLGQTYALHEPRIYWPVWSNYGSLVVLKATIDGGWLCPTKWKNQRVLLVCRCLKSITNHLDNDWEHIDTGGRAKHFILEDFFNDGGISDIHGQDYFENKSYLSFLELMVDSKAWISVFPTRPRLWTNLAGIIVPVLCWFNRQITDPKASKLINDHDPSLLEKMRTAMSTIFQKSFVPNFKTHYFSELVISTETKSKIYKTTGTSIKINVSTSSYSEEAIDYCPVEDHNADIISRIQTELFGKGLYPGVDQYPIPRSEWYPYLAIYLLNIFVKSLYRRSHPAFRGARYDILSENLFPYIVQCLPYAQTTPQNLNVLRAMKYLSKPVFYPPSGFCSEAKKFLERYEPDALSSEELSDFERWLRGIKEVST